MKEEDKLVNKAKNGEARAFGQLYDTYLTPIYRFVFLRVGGSKADAEDICHQTFLKAWQNIKDYEFQGFPFSSWLYRIAQNTVIDYYRTKKPNLDMEIVPEDALSETSAIDEKIDRDFELRTVRLAIAKLEPDQQNVILMKFVNDLSNKEIAAVLGKSEGAIRVIQHRALKQLKKHVDDTKGPD
ncbi:MAG: RNA polymerase ECF-type sigma factor [Candidatus Jorgensenbacteria bacterium GW2011_GWA1_48_11]|uniref:RNA polymerase ECF-type sigma factor n=1 Tax=Candidatus Jorgensenbacteria bacterium GW2011_GWA1_48_11 TaxID=1618660 RepID=A0A0G1XB26_9BACT|nr:MAG: RNA polymerase ECF-type sigma factor [Candidatus Jorgensenbacteria bacterium GW2011_GWA1_48_11]KKW12013.1 MAG: RNA polymerase ECF-type sigma factor [Candidatus Jorgensenbacteria bacterium GW2011_GWB1_49_9]